MGSRRGVKRERNGHREAIHSGLHQAAVLKKASVIQQGHL